MSRVIRCTAEACPESGPGYARLTLLDIDPFAGEAMRLSIDRGADANNILGPDGWQSETHWITPEAVETIAGRTSIVLGPTVTAQLRAGSNVKVRLSGDGGWPESETAVAWPAITGAASGASTGRRRVTLGAGRAAATPSPAPESPPEPVAQPAPTAAPEPEPEPIPEPPAPAPEPTKGGKGGLNPVLIVVLIAVLALGGAGLYFSGLLGGDGEAPVAETPGPWSSDEVRAYLGGTPNADDSLAQAEAQLRSGQPDLAFLLYKQAASEGRAEATAALGRMYDPDLHGPMTSPLPDPNIDRAVELYEEAAVDNDPVALRRLGILTVEGRHGGAPDPDAGRALLERAVEAGDTEAKTYLEGMN